MLMPSFCLARDSKNNCPLRSVAALTIVALTRPFIIGVDFHARTHTYAVIEASTKRQIACEQFPTTSAGISRALA